MRDSDVHELLNQALKGVLAGLGSGSGMTRSGTAVTVDRELQPGDDLLAPELVAAIADRPNGSYVVVASKVVAIAERRLVRVPRAHLPPRRAPRALLRVLKRNAPRGTVDLRDAIGADLIATDADTFTFALLPRDPNASASRLASSIEKRTGVRCDVVITDTSSGWTKGRALMGAPSVLATPIGMTAGCDLFYGQRLATLAEVIRNGTPLTPFVLVTPPTIRSLTRDRCGEMSYPGFVDARREREYLA